MTRRTRSRLSRLARVPAGVLAGVLACGVLLTACAQVPESGRVVEAKQLPAAVSPPEYYNPKPPQKGDSQSDIVTGFLIAMTATPLRLTTAQKFLTKQASAQWEPQRVLTYSDHTLAQPVQDHHVVVVRLQGADEVGSRGQWQGSPSPDAHRLVFPMVRENNEWRISQAPDALVMPTTFYDQQYQEAEIYFFDPSGRILVPEPVHVPQGIQVAQLASSLVRALARGPRRTATGVVRSFIPPGLTPAISVPVESPGVADVSLNGTDPGPLSRKTTQLILAQLTWTLRQDTSITSFRLSIAGHQITDSTGAATFPLAALHQKDPHDPARSFSSGLFYALRSGRLVSGQINQPTPVGGPFGTARLGIGPFAVRLDGNVVAGVTPSSLLLGSVQEDHPAVPVLTMPDLLRPAWDFAGRLWDMQNAPSGARVLYVQHGRHHRVHVPGISGQDVRRFLVSRDGSRVVAVIHGARSDRLVVSRLRYDADDRPVGATQARRIPWLSSGTTRIRDIGWTTPTTIEVLDRLSHSQAEARILNVDGSTSVDETSPITIAGTAIGLATSPAGTLTPPTPYAVLTHSLYDLAQDDVARTSTSPTIDTPGLSHITYAG